jgi:hypothetical protein
VPSGSSIDPGIGGLVCFLGARRPKSSPKVVSAVATSSAVRTGTDREHATRTHRAARRLVSLGVGWSARSVNRTRQVIERYQAATTLATHSRRSARKGRCLRRTQPRADDTRVGPWTSHVRRPPSARAPPCERGRRPRR